MPSLRDLSAAWNRRPVGWSRGAWALILVLDGLPWPWGEEIFARCWVARAFIRATRLRQALAWAAAQPGPGRGHWRLALSLCAYHGRFIARAALVGIHDPEGLQRRIAVRGEEHLATAGRGRILLSFHLGPRAAYLALRAGGHRLTWLGGRGACDAWSREIWDRYQHGRGDLFSSEREQAPVRHLYRARQILLNGGTVLLSADAFGREALAVSLPGGSLVVRSGWLALRRATGAPVLPVLSHMEGRTHVVTVHAALPPLGPDPVLDLDVCRRSLGDLLSEYVRRHAEQCYSLAVPLDTGNDR